MLRAFQSTHPSGVRQGEEFLGVFAVGISIHAPQWGATVRQIHRIRVPVIISIHAPQWGATVTGGAPAVLNLISIHAPQWGATPNR